MFTVTGTDEAETLISGPFNSMRDAEKSCEEYGARCLIKKNGVLVKVWNSWVAYVG